MKMDFFVPTPISSFVTIVMLLSASCSSQKTEYDAPEYYDLSDYQNVKVDDVLEVAEVVPLLFESDTYPKGPTHITFLDNNMVFEDIEDKIHVFSEEGHFIGCSSVRKGQGPGEFTMLLGHVVNPFKQTIDIITIRKLMSYNSDFSQFKGECMIPTIVGTSDKLLYDDGMALSDSRYVFHSSIVTDPYKVIIYDSQKGESVNEWNYEDDVISYFNTGMKKFFRMPDGEVLMTGGGYTPYIYGIDSTGNNLYKAIQFSYGGRTITDHVTIDDFRKNHDVQKIYLDRGVELPCQQMVNSKKIVSVIRNGSDYRKDFYIIISDRANGKNYRFEPVEDSITKILYFQTMDEDYIYSLFRKMDLLENPGCLLNKAAQAEELLAKIDDEDFVLVKFRIK